MLRYSKISRGRVTLSADSEEESTRTAICCCCSYAAKSSSLCFCALTAVIISMAINHRRRSERERESPLNKLRINQTVNMIESCARIRRFAVVQLRWKLERATVCYAWQTYWGEQWIVGCFLVNMGTGCIWQFDMLAVPNSAWHLISLGGVKGPLNTVNS